MSDFKLQIDCAEKIIFSGKKLGEENVNTQVKITNPLKEKVAIKVKCTSNETFRIRPPVGTINAGETMNVDLTFNSGKSVPDNGKHYFAFYFVTAKDDKKNARQVWADHKGEPEGTKKIFVDFKKDGGEEKKEEKKEDAKKDEKKEDAKKDEKKEEPKKDEKKDEKKEDKKEDKKDDKKDEKKDEDKKDEGKDDSKEEDKKE